MSRIKELRLGAKLSQRQLGEICGIHQTAVSQWESGRTSPDIESLTKLARFFGVSIESLMGEESREIPVLGYVQAGLPVEALEDVLGYEQISSDLASRGEYFALRINGDSMAPRMCEGDVVIVRCQQDVDSGDTAVVLLGSENSTIKKVIKKDTSLMLVPTNPEYEPMVFTSDEIDSVPVTIIGKVVELRAKY